MREKGAGDRERDRAEKETVSRQAYIRDLSRNSEACLGYVSGPETSWALQKLVGDTGFS
jgi:hypothetical protein